MLGDARAAKCADTTLRGACLVVTYLLIIGEVSFKWNSRGPFTGVVATLSTSDRAVKYNESTENREFNRLDAYLMQL